MTIQKATFTSNGILLSFVTAAFANGSTPLLLFAPNTASNARVVGIASAAFPAVMNLGMQGYESTDALLDAYSKSAALQTSAIAAVLFEADNVGNYTIALSRMLCGWTEDERRTFHWSDHNSYRLMYEGVDNQAVWLSSGFVFLQSVIDRAIFALHTPNGTAASASVEAVMISRFPLQPYASTYGGYWGSRSVYYAGIL